MSFDICEIFYDTARRILADQPSDTWAVLVDAGFDRALLPESKGGANLSWADAFGLLAIAGEYAAVSPLAEAMIGHWLLERAGIEGVQSPTFALLRQPGGVQLRREGDVWRVNGSLARVAGARGSTHIAFLSAESPAQLVVISRDASGITITPEHNLADEQRDTLHLDAVTPLAVAPAPLDAETLLTIAAIARSASMAGAIERTLALTVEYANMRVQFGRPIGQFQVIQQNIAVLATQAAAARAAAQSGSEAIDDWLAGESEPPARSIAALSAKIRTGEAAGQVSAIAHQVFGAIGFTEEHDLHLFTKRLWSWRDEYGNEAFWSQRLGDHILDTMSDETLWLTVAPVGRTLHKEAAL